MNIGIVGNGKMGNEIFWLTFNSGHNVVIMCVLNAREYEAKIKKQLAKMLKRGIVDQAGYDTYMSSYKVTENYDDFRDCDLVIEAVPENPELKRQIFSTLERVTDNKCILATNTSSIPLNQIFSSCTLKERCAGLHFFYPVMLSSSVEINTEDFTSHQTINTLSQLVTQMQKNPLILKDKFNMFINMAIAVGSSHVCYSIFCSNISLSDARNKIIPQYMECSVFDIIDSVGTQIIGTSIRNFMNDENRSLLSWYMEHVFSNSEFGLKDSTADPEKCKNEIILSFYAVLMNLTAYAYKEGNCSFSIIKAILEDMFMLHKGFNEVYHEYGYELLTSFLDQYDNRMPCRIYNKISKSVYDEVFGEGS
ncbi:MAG: 3-hydroxyacyl-CoA dehydrogenase family protein [Oscillospiraceae bacterium]|nr:3-hydroxyacyl-CoA dehydrogenase family protein [Oscillospiraceae bacterium]